MNEDSLDVVLLIVNEDVIDLRDESILDETVFRVKYDVIDLIEE